MPEDLVQTNIMQTFEFGVKALYKGVIAVNGVARVTVLSRTREECSYYLRESLKKLHEDWDRVGPVKELNSCARILGKKGGKAKGKCKVRGNKAYYRNLVRLKKFKIY